MNLFLDKEDNCILCPEYTDDDDDESVAMLLPPDTFLRREMPQKCVLECYWESLQRFPNPIAGFEGPYF